MEVFNWINQLVTYGVKNQLIAKEDIVYTRNTLLEKLNLQYYENNDVEEDKEINHIEVLENLIKYAYENNIIKSVNPPFSDLFDTALMATMIPAPSIVNERFWSKYGISAKNATDYFYKLSIDSNYIRMNRVKKNLGWKVATKYGDINITVNLSKPEKDPKAIAMQKNIKQTGYPKCLLCHENVGYQGSINHPARQNHRVIPMKLNAENWYFQYSPYIYFNEHSIVLKEQHTPMKIDKNTFKRLLDFVDILPHYFIGSNADLPIVGGSMLSHDHYQAGCFEFPMERAEKDQVFKIDGFEDVEIYSLNWPLTVIRLKSKVKNKLINLAELLTKGWRNYSDESANIISKSKDGFHNTVTPIARIKEDVYELDIVLRNNRVTEQYPDGIFHPHNEIHPVKKENIGLIEVMGLAVLPSRLILEMKVLEDALKDNKGYEYIKDNKEVAKFADIYKEIYEDNNEMKLAPVERLKAKIGEVFVSGLEHCGVFGLDENGKAGLRKFIDWINGGEKCI